MDGGDQDSKAGAQGVRQGEGGLEEEYQKEDTEEGVYWEMVRDQQGCERGRDGNKDGEKVDMREAGGRYEDREENKKQEDSLASTDREYMIIFLIL